MERIGSDTVNMYVLKKPAKKLFHLCVGSLSNLLSREHDEKNFLSNFPVFPTYLLYSCLTDSTSVPCFRTGEGQSVGPPPGRGRGGEVYFSFFLSFFLDRRRARHLNLLLLPSSPSLGLWLGSCLATQKGEREGKERSSQGRAGALLLISPQPSLVTKLLKYRIFIFKYEK